MKRTNFPLLLSSSWRRPTAGFALIIAMLLFASVTPATIVQTTTRTINNGRADFGSGTHAGGEPGSRATITYDWSPVAGQIMFTGRVRGTLFWDALISSGCARLTVRFRNAANANLNVQTATVCGPGGNANDASNKTAVDISFSSVNLSHIVLTTAVVENNAEVSAASFTFSQVEVKDFPVLIANGAADFGDGFHAVGFPTEPAHVKFRRNAGGTISSIVDGVLFWDSLGDDSCSRLILDRRNITGAILDRDPFLNCGPGGDANNGANQLFVSNNTFTSGSMFDVRLDVADTAFPARAVSEVFGFAGSVGDFEVEPAEAFAAINETFFYPLLWTVPEPLNWHDLDTLELRIRDGATTILHLRYQEEGDLISVYDPDKGGFGEPVAIGANRELQTRFATLLLEQTKVGPVNSALGEGPNSPTIRLNLALRFKASAIGKSYSVEAAATDDLGNRDPFAVAGTLAVVD